MPEPIVNPDPNQPGGSQGQPQPTPQPSAFDSFVQKKGFKSSDDVVKSYEEVEKSYTRTTTAIDKAKKQLEQHGYTINDEGDVVEQNPQQYQQPYQQPYGQQQQQQQQQETVYDPYTGQVINNQLDLQLSRLPLAQRTAVVVNAILNQRDNYTTESRKAEAELFAKPEARGFEDDVRNVMQKLPLEMRIKKENWEDALLKVKGMRYDEALKNAGAQGVDSFLNKAKNQGIPGSSGSGDNIKLSEEQEKTFRWYQENKPGMFKDKAHFLTSLSPTAGR